MTSESTKQNDRPIFKYFKDFDHEIKGKKIISFSHLNIYICITYVL